MLTTNIFWLLISQSDTVTRIILGMLLIMSVFSWSLAASKLIGLRIRNRQFKKSMKILSGISTLQDLIPKAAEFPSGFISDFISQYLSGFKVALKFKPNNLSNMQEEDWKMFHSNMNLVIDDAINKEQSPISLLSIIAQVAPLLGLFGTIWGLIHSFLSIGFAESLDISVVAPGIAEALITTLAGLVVAIPALALYNFLQNRLMNFEQNLMMISDKCYWIIKSVSFDRNEHKKMTYSSNFDTSEKENL